AAPGREEAVARLPVRGLSQLGGAVGGRARHRRRDMAWSAARDGRDSGDDAAEDLLERHRLIVVIADVHRVAAGADRVGGQGGREVARGHLDRPVADGEQAVAGLDRLAYVRLAGLSVVDADVM